MPSVRNGFIPFFRPTIESDEIEAVVNTLKSGWITTGPVTHEFEKRFAAGVGSACGVAVNSCTAALHLALEAIGVARGDEVVTSPMTFAATAEVVRYLGGRPVFVDIDPITMNIDVGKLDDFVRRRVRKGRRSRLKAIIPVHFAGWPSDMDDVMDIARRYGLMVVEDAAHAFPTLYKGRPIGSIGDITCFSFYATKNITTGEGGMATTDNREWAERMRIMSLHGISKDAWNRYSAEGSWYYEIIAPGFKYNMTDMAAALGIAQLSKAERLWRGRKRVAGMYNEAFGTLDSIEKPFNDASGTTRHSWHLYVIKLNLEKLTITRNRFIEELKSRGVGASVHFIPLHIHPYYRKTYAYEPEDLPLAYKIYERIVSLPIYPGMTDDEIGRVIEAVRDIVTTFRR